MEVMWRGPCSRSELGRMFAGTVVCTTQTQPHPPGRAVTVNRYHYVHHQWKSVNPVPSRNTIYALPDLF